MCREVRQTVSPLIKGLKENAESFGRCRTFTPDQPLPSLAPPPGPPLWAPSLAPLSGPPPLQVHPRLQQQREGLGSFLMNRSSLVI